VVEGLAREKREPEDKLDDEEPFPHEITCLAYPAICGVERSERLSRIPEK
jgi:hypothetical protein